MSDENQSATISGNKISFQYNDHANVLCEKMYNYFKEQEFCDVIIKADQSTSNNEICAHRSVLSSHSEYFSNIFRSKTQFANETEIIIKNITEELLTKIIEYCYTGKLEVENNIDSVEQLLNKARYFKIKFLEETCIKWLMNHSSLWPLDGYRLDSFEKLSAELRGKLIESICENFMQIYKSEKFLKLSAKKLAKIIAQDNISVESEKNILDALLSWLNYNFAERHKQIGKLLPLIRFPFLQPAYISSQLKTICKSNESMKLMLEALEWHTVPENRASLKWICTKERQFGSLIMIIGNGSSTDAAKFFEVYNPMLKKSFGCHIMPKKRQKFEYIAATVMDNELIVAGGSENDEPVSMVYKLNLTTLTWTQLPSMLMRRAHFKLIVLQHKMYAVGGQPQTNTVECWDPTINVWKFVSGMSADRDEHCVIELDNKLYALGGWNGDFETSSVECYEVNLDKWTIKASMNKRRVKFSVGILNDFLYAIGGDVDHYNTVERYDAKANKWTLLHNIDEQFTRLKCISLHNCFIGTVEYMCSTQIVKYDPVTNKMTVQHMLRYKRREHEVLEIPHIKLSNFQ